MLQGASAAGGTPIPALARRRFQPPPAACLHAPPHPAFLRRRPFFQHYHLIIVQDGDPTKKIEVPEGE